MLLLFWFKIVSLYVRCVSINTQRTYVNVYVCLSIHNHSHKLNGLVDDKISDN